MLLPIHLWQLVFQRLAQPHTISINLSANRILTAFCSPLVPTPQDLPLYKRNHIFSREESEDSGGWSRQHVLILVLVVVIAVVVSVVGYAIWYRLQAPSHQEFRSRLKRLFTRTQRVQSSERNDSWNIDGSLGAYYGRGPYQDPLHPNSPYWVSRTARRVKASVQGSVTTVLRSLPTAPWNQPRQIVSQRPSNGFNVDDQDTPSPIRPKASWWRLAANTGPRSTGAATTSSTTSSNSTASASAPMMFGVVQRSGSSFDIVDQPGDQDFTEEEQEKMSLLPRSPTRTTRSGSVILISRTGKNFSLRTATTSSAHPTSPNGTIPPTPLFPRPPAATSPRPLPPIPTQTGRIPPVPTLPPPPQPEPSARTLGAFPAPPPAHHRSSSSGSDGLKRKAAMRYPESRKASMSSISLQIPLLPYEPDPTSLPSPGSPAHSGMQTPVTPPPPDRLIQWQASSQERFYQPFCSRSRSSESISISNIRTN